MNQGIEAVKRRERVRGEAKVKVKEKEDAKQIKRKHLKAESTVSPHFQSR